MCVNLKNNNTNNDDDDDDDVCFHMCVPVGQKFPGVFFSLVHVGIHTK